jgi:prevent-host-death family protein
VIAYSATEAKQNFAAMLDAAAKQPVVIRRHDRDIAMLISPEEYARLHRLNVEKLLALCDQAGKEAEANGLTDEILADLLAGDD